MLGRGAPHSIEPAGPRLPAYTPIIAIKKQLSNNPRSTIVEVRAVEKAWKTCYSILWDRMQCDYFRRI